MSSDRRGSHPRARLAAWPPWVRGEIHLALLYHFGQRALARFPAGHSIQADPAHCLGSQAHIFSRAAPAHIVEKIDRESPLHQDEQMARLASALDPVHITSPRWSSTRAKPAPGAATTIAHWLSRKTADFPNH